MNRTTTAGWLVGLRSLAGAVLMVFAMSAAGLAADQPAVFFVRGQAVFQPHLVVGSGFEPDQTRVWVQEFPLLGIMKTNELAPDEETLLAALQSPLPALPADPPKKDDQGRAVSIDGRHRLSDRSVITITRPIAVRPEALMFELNSMQSSWGQKVSRIVWVQTPGGISSPVMSRPLDIWIVWPETAQQGQWVRLLGRHMDVYHRSYRLAAVKNRATGKVTRVKWGLPVLTNQEAGDSDYETFIQLPDNLPAGQYDVYLHNGSGGVYGWSRPISLAVRVKQAPTLPSVAHLEIKPGDRVAAELQGALNRLTGSGKVALLMEGKYGLEMPLTIPKGVTLRGVAADLVTLTAGQPSQPAIVLADDSTLETVTVEQRSGKAPAIQMGDGRGAVAGVFINRCRFVAEPGAPNEKTRYCGLALASPSRNVRIRDCRLDGRHLVGIFADAARLWMAYCQAGLQSEAGLTQSIIEYNEVREAPGTYLARVATADVSDNVFIWNKVVRAKPLDLPNGFIFNASRAGANATVASATAQTMRLDGRVEHTGGWLVVMSGKGLGQWARIAKAGRELTLEQPLAVAPERGDAVYLGPLFIRNLIADNMDIDGGSGAELLGACVDNRVFFHMSERTRGLLFAGTQGKDTAAAPCYGNVAENIYVYYGGSAGVAAIRPGVNQGPVLAFGQYIYKADLCDSRRLPYSIVVTAPAGADEQIRAGGFWLLDRRAAENSTHGIAGTMFIGGRVAHSGFSVGISVGHGVTDTFLGSTIIYGSPESIADYGKNTYRQSR